MRARTRFCARLLVVLALAGASLSAQRGEPIAQQLVFAPYHASGIYDVGETVGWTVTPGAAIVVSLVVPLLALDGQPGIHDPSTVVQQNGKFYTSGTGNGLPTLVSDDGWTWRRAGTLMQGLPGGRPGPDVIARGGNNSWAPDVIHVGDKYFVYYAAPGTQPKAAIGLLVGKALDPDSPDYKWEDGGPVVWSDGVEDSHATTSAWADRGR